VEYQSKYTDRKIKPAQRIVELICERFFGKDGISLPKKFWNDRRFSREYRLQLIKVHALLKVYSPEAIIAALTSPKGKRIWSLGAKWLDSLISVEERKLKLLNEKKVAYMEQKKSEEIEVSVEEENIISNADSTKKTQSLFEKLDG